MLTHELYLGTDLSLAGITQCRQCSRQSTQQRIARLQHGLEDLGVGLHDLAQALELRVAAQEVQGALPC